MQGCHRTFGVNARVTAPARTIVAKAPIAADSVGVAQPATIAPTTKPEDRYQRHHIDYERTEPRPPAVFLEIAIGRQFTAWTACAG